MKRIVNLELIHNMLTMAIISIYFYLSQQYVIMIKLENSCTVIKINRYNFILSRHGSLLFLTCHILCFS